MIRSLVIDDDQRGAIRHLVTFASNPDNWYRPYVDSWNPGDRIEYTYHADTYRCVFTYTEMASLRVFRHLSISVSGKGYPNIAAVLQLASMFGFLGGTIRDGICTEAPDSWLIGINKNEHCITAVQEILQ